MPVLKDLINPKTWTTPAFVKFKTQLFHTWIIAFSSGYHTVKGI